MATYKTPGVYVEEISTLPPSVAEVATAIPAFIGYTQKVPTITDSFRVNKESETSLEFSLSGQPLPGGFTSMDNHLFAPRNLASTLITNYNDGTKKITVDVSSVDEGTTFTVTYPVVRPIRIGSMLEYKTHFGGAYPSPFDIPVHTDDKTGAMQLGTPVRNKEKEFLLYYCMSLYFSNGGGPCYIISVGNYDQNLNSTAFEAGLRALSKEDEPTLILLTDTVNLAAPDYYTLGQAALNQCAELKDRFAILDVLRDDLDATGFRQGIGQNNLKYGAAYTPYLATVIPYAYDESEVNLKDIILKNPKFRFTLGPDGEEQKDPDAAGIQVTYSGPEDKVPKVKISLPTGGNEVEEVTFKLTADANNPIFDIQLPEENGAQLEAIKDAFTSWKAETPTGVEPFKRDDIDLETIGASDTTFKTTTSNTAEHAMVKMDETVTLADEELRKNFTGLYNEALAALAKQRVVMPPSAAMAGIYASVDRSRGVWKAPANVSVNAVIGPVRVITAQDQENLNIDVNSGKSINAIRSFTGKGTLVWGARTLAGNDNEWRYISVRRLFNMIEESLQKATAFAVFEPNDASTWLKVKAMAESYLFGLWQQGALAGPTPEQAYFVNVGLGKSMSAQDILEGRMIVELGIAAVRPAEFIVLRFSHKLQEA